MASRAIQNWQTPLFKVQQTPLFKVQQTALCKVQQTALCKVQQTALQCSAVCRVLLCFSTLFERCSKPVMNKFEMPSEMEVALRFKLLVHCLQYFCTVYTVYTVYANQTALYRLNSSIFMPNCPYILLGKVRT